MIPIHPSSSYEGRYSVSLLIAYIELEIIIRGANLMTEDAALMMAVISATWFDWDGPGILIVWFLSSLGPNQMPLLHLAFSLPLLRQAPSV